jgi:hypothetical protein
MLWSLQMCEKCRPAGRNATARWQAQWWNANDGIVRRGESLKQVCRSRVRIKAKDSFSLTELYGERPKSTGYGPPPQGPLVAVQTADGQLGVLRVTALSKQGITGHLRGRPK